MCVVSSCYVCCNFLHSNRKLIEVLTTLKLNGRWWEYKSESGTVLVSETLTVWGSRERQINKALRRSIVRAGAETGGKWYSSQMGKVAGRRHRKLDLN